MSKRAKLLASLAAQAPLLLFVGKKVTASAVANASYRKHKCTACPTEVAFAEVPGVVPYCPSCGSTTAPVAGDAIPMAPQEELLTSVNCPHCQSANVVEDRTTEALAGVMHCAACGNGVNFKATAEAADSDIETEPLTDGNDGEEGAGENRTGDQPKDVQGVHSAAAAATPVKVKADTDDDNGEPDDGIGDIGDDVDSVDIDVPDQLNEDDDVDVQMDDDGEEARLLAFVGGVHAYTMTKQTAGDNADLIGQTSFHQALQRECAKSGHRALASYGFTPVTLKVNLGKVVNKRVQATLAGEKAAVQASLTDVRDNFEQCAKIAAVALTQRFYKNRANPLQDTLVAALNAAGVKQAKTFVNRAMVQAGPQFVTALLELADELMDKSLDHRNELSDSLTEMSPEAINAEVDPDTDSPEADAELRTSPEEITARLSNPVQQTRRTTQTAGLTDTGASSMAAQLRQLKNL